MQKIAAGERINSAISKQLLRWAVLFWARMAELLICTAMVVSGAACLGVEKQFFGCAGVGVVGECDWVEEGTQMRAGSRLLSKDARFRR